MRPATDLETASRARDHMANERTYLAWLRTAAAVMALGLAVAKVFENTSGDSVVAGAILVAVGGLGIIYGSSRYRAVAREIESGEFAAGTRTTGPIVAAAVLFVTMIAAVVLVLA